MKEKVTWAFGQEQCAQKAQQVTLHTCGQVGQSVGWSVPILLFLCFCGVFAVASLHLPKCSSNSNTAPAHPHAARVAMYPALFSSVLVSIDTKITKSKQVHDF